RVLLPFEAVPRIPLGQKKDGAGSDSGGSRWGQGLGKRLPPRGLLPPPPVCFSPSGRFLYSGGDESGAVLVWRMDLETGQVMGEMALHGHSAPVTCLSTAGLEGTGQDLLLSGSADGTAMLWRLGRMASTFRLSTAPRSPSLVIRGHRAPITACVLSDSLGLALTCSGDMGWACTRGRALLHGTEGTTLLRALPPPPELVPRSGGDPWARVGPGAGAGGGGEAFLRAKTHYAACALGDAGYAAIASTCHFAPGADLGAGLEVGPG
ncbi:unnamed protein product, partial [Discosporangium mesarthrocarpum]